ncbi:MAG: hypothetical protein V1750_09640 [Acidobacteriota bacterium]
MIASDTASATTAPAIRLLLLLADTQLGFDLPARPRSDRPRRGRPPISK